MSNQEEQKSDLLQKKPQRQTGRRLMPLLISLGVIVILAGALVAVWRVYATNSASPSTNATPTQTAKGGSSSSRSSPWDNYPPVYWQTLRAQFAQGMHMTQPQIQENLRSTYLATQTPTNSGRVEINETAASQWLSGLAQTQGISQEQLHTIEATAVQQAHSMLVDQHVLTQQQADETIHGMSQDDLNMHIMDAFLMCSGGKASCDD
ncbi:MAG: hypothetical protein J2P36_06095 [Ktedonobacteraceae bacterium]|nr:hypothetical protein [Ktedonobacteraceae bacterium]